MLTIMKYALGIFERLHCMVASRCALARELYGQGNWRGVDRYDSE